MKYTFTLATTTLTFLLSFSGCDTLSNDTNSTNTTEYEGKWRIVSDGTYNGYYEINSNTRTAFSNMENSHLKITGYRKDSIDIVGTKRIAYKNTLVSKVDTKLLECSYYLTPKSEVELNVLIDKNICDIDWQLNKKADLSTCKDVCDYENISKDIFFLNETGLRTGQVNDDTDAEGYPQTLDMDEILLPCSNTEECSSVDSD